MQKERRTQKLVLWLVMTMCIAFAFPADIQASADRRSADAAEVVLDGQKTADAAEIVLDGQKTADAAESVRTEQKVIDEVGIIPDGLEDKLQEQLIRIAQDYEYDAVILTVDSCSPKSTRQFAEDYYLSKGYGFGPESDGIMMLVSMGERQYYFATFGNATDIFTAYGLERIDELVSEELSDGDYEKAFSLFADLAGEFVREGTKGKPYDRDHTYKQRMGLGMRLLIASISGLVIAAVTVGALFGQMRSVGIKAGAQEYVRDGSFRVTRQRDVFLYRTVSRIRKEKPADSKGGGGGGATHRTSSGGRAGGRGGSF